MDKTLNYQEHYKHEAYIQELLQYHSQKYKYVGEKGKEYGVVQSIFYEINQLSRLSNQHIRWYSVILCLVDHFYQQRTEVFLKGYPLTNLGPVTNIRVAINWDESPLDRFFVPQYIELAEMYISGVARLGILASAKQEITEKYFSQRLIKLAMQMTALLKNKNMNDNDNSRADIFLLSLKNSTDNISLLGKMIFKDESNINCLDQFLNWQTYQCLIEERAKGLSNKRRTDCYNMDAFWNGFIP